METNKGNTMDTITVNGITYVKQTAVAMSDYYIIRTYSAGVHFGKIESREGKEVKLCNARRIWYWEGAASLSQMALDGVSKPEKCKFSVMIPEIILTEAIEIIKCSDKATNIILKVPEWKA